MLEDFTSAPISVKLRSTLEFLKKLTLQPELVTAADARNVLEQGVSREALRDAIHVAYLFNLYDRLADAMGWDVPAAQSGYYEVAARTLLKRGYA